MTVVLLVTMGLGGCDQGCEATCRKVLKCDGLETNELTIGECNAECVRQVEYYETQEDEAGAEAFSDHKACVKKSSCEDILDGVCYDPDVFGF